MKHLTRSVFGSAIVMGLALAAASAADRLAPLTADQMTPAQKQVADAILSGPRSTVSGPRKALTGPFNAWIRNPDLADRLQKVGEYIRFNTSLPHRLNEFAILITAREWTSQYEWGAHYPLAIKAGLDPKVADELALGKRPSTMQDDEKIVYDFSIQLHRDKKVDDATYKAALAKLGEQGVVDLIGVDGYYSVVSMTLNVAEVLPPDGKLPLPPLAKQ